MQNRSDAFDAIMEPLTSTYMAWDLERPEEGHIFIEHGPAPLSRKTRDMRVMRVLDLFHLSLFIISIPYFHLSSRLFLYYCTAIH